MPLVPDSRILSTESASIYVDYEPKSVPLHPGDGWTRFVCISDTHSRPYDVPLGDVLLHAGDLSSWGYPHQIKNVLGWLSSLKHPTKIFIAGNHDLCLDSSQYENNPHVSTEDRQDLRNLRSSLKTPACASANLFYLEHEALVLRARSGKDWHFYGSPAAPRYATGAFQYTTKAEADAIYRGIPKETEILITHTPPSGILDETKHGKHAGCQRLLKRLDSLGSCRLHVFGHIHESPGAVILPCGRVAVNAALAWGGRPVVVDLKDFPASNSDT